MCPNPISSRHQRRQPRRRGLGESSRPVPLAGKT
nr:MAG TPA: hypothetical protein [Caudoviricetes sp.]